MVAFAANSLLNRAALEATETGPASFAALRLASGALCLGVLALISGQFSALRPSRALWPRAGALGLYMLGFSFAYVTLPSGVGALLLFGGVQITMFALAASAGEKIALARALGAAIAFSGLVVLMAPGTAHNDWLGAVLMLAAAIGWGAFSFLGRHASAPLSEMAAAFLWCTPLALGLWALRPDGIDSQGAVLAIVSGAVTSGLGYALWYAVLPKLQTSLASVAQLTVPIIAAIAGALFLSETLDARFALSSLLVLGGVLIALVPRR